MAFNYFNNQSYIGSSQDVNTRGISSLDSNRQNIVAIGGALFKNTTAGSDYTHTWTVPNGVFSVSVVCIGAGGGGLWYYGYGTNWTIACNGGGGGALAWINGVTVTPGESISIQVGGAGEDGRYQSGVQYATAGGASFFKNTSIINANGGAKGAYNSNVGGQAVDIPGSTYTVSTSYGTYGGGNGGGGNSTSADGYGPTGGGGAGGYSGNGGDGRDSDATKGDDGSGGGAPGGGASHDYAGYVDHISGGGGGVNPYGEGSSGTGNTNGAGGGGSGGENTPQPVPTQPNQDGGDYGGGGGGKSSRVWGSHAGQGGQGVVRVIWGPGRAFPSTNVGQNYLGITETTYTN